MKIITLKVPDTLPVEFWIAWRQWLIDNNGSHGQSVTAQMRFFHMLCEQYGDSTPELSTTSEAFMIDTWGTDRHKVFKYNMTLSGEIIHAIHELKAAGLIIDNGQPCSRPGQSR